jgi:hypothetical protein
MRVKLVRKQEPVDEFWFRDTKASSYRQRTAAFRDGSKWRDSTTALRETFGGGYETAIAQNWRLRVEYLYCRFDDVKTADATVTSADGCLASACTSHTHSGASKFMLSVWARATISNPIGAPTIDSWDLLGQAAERWPGLLLC